MKCKGKSGFTLLEVIIVIIIVGVLASLALPRFFATVEYSKSTEALQSIATIRQSLERCYVKYKDYGDCDDIGTNLDIEDPGGVPGAHFSYTVGAATSTYTVTATRTTYDNPGDALGDTIYVTMDGSTITKGGTDTYADIAD